MVAISPEPTTATCFEGAIVRDMAIVCEECMGGYGQ